MEKLLISNIISHGFLDFYNQYFDNHYQFLQSYLVMILFNCILMYNYPSLITLVFILMSIIHFGKDFVYITNNQNSMPLGYTLFFFTLLWDQHFWTETLQLITYSNDKIIINILYLLFFRFMSLLIFDSNIINIIIFFIQGILSYQLGIYYFLLYYMSLIHVPLAIYQIVNCYGIKPLIIHLILLPIMYFVPIIINKYIIILSISIVNTHMLIRN